jgi:hypothetical protein
MSDTQKTEVKLPKEGAVKIEDLERAIKSQDWEGLPVKPKAGCKRCYGRGHQGFSLTLGHHNYCDCVWKGMAR